MNIKLKVLTILGVVLLLSCEVLDIRGRGAISITTQPTGCEVYIDGDATGDTTNCVLGDIPKGLRMTLGLVKEDYLDWGGWVEVSGVDTLYIEKTFTGSLKVASTPSGADITIDGESTSKITPYTFDSLVIGSHSLRLEYAGYASVDTTVDVFYEEQTVVSEKLDQQFGQIQVNSTPTGADIYLDGSNTGYTTNYLLENVALGEHEVKLTLEGYVDWYDTVTVSEGQTEYIVATLDEATGNIQVNSTPTGASIYLDGSNTDRTTNALLEDVKVGSHTVKLVKEGYEDWQQDVTVNEEQTTTVDADLSAETGKIQVNSTPTGATIWLDGSTTGDTTNYLLDDIEPGFHTIGLTKTGYTPWEEEVIVVKGLTTAVYAHLCHSDHDVATKRIDYPSGYVEKDGNYTVKATVINFGDNVGSTGFPVTCSIIPFNSGDTLFQNEQTVSYLNSGAEKQVTFDPWTVPSYSADYEIMVATDQEGDCSNYNDTIRTVVTAQ